MSDVDLESIIKKDTELIYDKSFINKVYKRTERVCNALFYIVDKTDIKDVINESSIIGHIKNDIPKILKDASALLVCNDVSVKRLLVTFESSLMYLSSLVTLSVTSERMQASYGGLITLEIETLLGELELFRNKDRDIKVTRSSVLRRRLVNTVSSPYEVARGSDGAPVPTVERTSGVDRKERIKTILREKGQSGIKDISDIIKDVSEKSIQRDLNDLIETGEVVRIGERRWSTYKISV